MAPQLEHGLRWIGGAVTGLVLMVVGLQVMGLIAAVRQAADQGMNPPAADGRVAGLRQLAASVPAGETLVVFDESRHRPLVQARQLRMRLAWFRYPDAVVGSRDADWDAIRWLYYDGPLEGEFRLQGIGGRFERHVEHGRHVIYRAIDGAVAESASSADSAGAAGIGGRAAGNVAPLKLDSPGWRGWAGGTLAFAAVWWVGWIWVGRWLPHAGAVERLWLGLPTGQTVFMLMAHALMLGGIGLALWQQAATLVALAVLGAWLPRRPGLSLPVAPVAVPAVRRMPVARWRAWFPWVAGGVLLTVAGWHGWLSQQQPLDCLPGLGNWGYKAVVIATESGLPDDFPAAARWNAHQAEYPLGLPLLLQWPLSWGYHDGAAALKLLNVVWVAAAAGLAGSWLYRQGAGRLLALAVAALLLTHESARLFATDLYAEPVLWCHALAACMLAAGSYRERALALLLAAGCALLKHEGLLVMAGVGMWCVLTAGGWRHRVTTTAMVAALVAVSVLPWWWCLGSGGVGTEDFSEVAGGADQWARWEATWTALSASWGRAFGWADLARVWPWLLFATWLGAVLRMRITAGNRHLAKRRLNTLPLVTTALLTLSAQVVVFYFSSHPVEWHTRVVGRTALLPFWLLAVAAAAACALAGSAKTTASR